VDDEPSPRPFVLVPGACLGGWVWKEVADALREEGHDVYPVTLTGLGERVHLATPDVDLETHIMDVVNLLEYEDLHEVVLVGHSYAGIVVTGVADRCAARLHTVVYLDCSPLPDAMSLADVQPESMRSRQRRDVRDRGEGWRWPVPDRETLESGMFGSVSGMTEEHLELVQRLGTPQPFKTFTSALELEHEVLEGVQRAAIFCTDGGVDVRLLQSLLEQGDPRAAMFAGPDWQLYELPTGHWAMFSEPELAAEVLAKIAEE
jgi:pimeloyl-ACP methyl ester carboxylesterase